MVTNTFLGIVRIIMNIFFGIVNLFLGKIIIVDDLLEIIREILTVTQQALNFMYLLFGDTLFVVLPFVLLLLTEKYVVLPIVQILRSIFINSNE